MKCVSTGTFIKQKETGVVLSGDGFKCSDDNCSNEVIVCIGDHFNSSPNMNINFTTEF